MVVLNDKIIDNKTLLAHRVRSEEDDPTTQRNIEEQKSDICIKNSFLGSTIDIPNTQYDPKKFGICKFF